MSWKAIAFSEAGASHQKLRLAKFIKLNDFGETVNDGDIDGDIIIGAVSKSSEGCKHSDIGSQLAVETAINYLQGKIKFVGVNKAKKNLLLDISKEDAGQVIQQFFLQTVTKVIENFKDEAQKKSCSLQDLSCTLLVMLATPKWLASMQIGDGFLAIRQPESEYQLLFQPTKEQSANQAIFVTDRNALQLMQFNISFGVPEFIFASTDSGELALDIGEQSDKQSFFEICRTAITSSSEDEAKKIIQARLKSDTVNITANQHTTLVCFYKSPLSELNDENQSLKQKLHQFKLQLSTLQYDSQKLTEKLEQRDKELSEVINNLSYRQSENKSLTQKLSKLESEKTNLTQKISKLESEKEKLTQKISKLESEKENLTQKISNLESEKENLTQNISGFQSQSSKLESENKKLNDDNQTLKRELSTLQDDHQKLTENLEQRDKKLSGLQSTKNEVYTHLLDINIKNKQLIKQLSILESDNKKLTQQISQAPTKLSYVAKVSTIIATATTTAATAFGGVSFFQYQERNQVIKQIEQIRQQNNLSPGQWDLSSYSLESEWENLVNFIKQDEEPLVSEDLDELIEAMETKTETSINELQQKISNLEATNSQLEEEKKSLQSRNAELEAQNNYVQW